MFHVITPMARFENFCDLIDMLEPLGVQWHIIIDEGAEQSINIDKEKYPWIHYYVCPNEGVLFYERCNYCINWFIKTQEIIDEDIYLILNDDDAYSENFFSILSPMFESIDHAMVSICSMERGHNIPASAIGCRAHPPTKLWAATKNLHVGGVGIEQIALKGKILKEFQIPLLNDGDGRFIVEVVKKYSGNTVFVPEANILFNYFEPGRWNK